MNFHARLAYRTVIPTHTNFFCGNQAHAHSFRCILAKIDVWTASFFFRKQNTMQVVRGVGTKTKP